MILKDGTLIDERYRISSFLASGGMADIYRAIDVINKKEVAIKIIKEKLLEDPLNVRQFKNEMTIAANLKHPNIVKVLNQGVINETPYIVNEYINGDTLKNILDFRSCLTVNESLDYISQLLLALNYAHQHNVIHRDIKPENIFLLADGTIKLADFGIAFVSSLESFKKENKVVMGSVSYLAPEIINGKSASVKSDIYAVGITLFEMLTGRLPFEGNNSKEVMMAHLKQKMPSVNKYSNNIPKEIDSIIQKACHKNINKRYISVNEFYDEVIYFIKNGTLLNKKGLKKLLCKD